MRTPITLLLCLMATACGGKKYQVDSQIQPYVDRFVAESNKVGRPVVVDNLAASIGTVAGADWAGQCEPGASPPTIILNQADWATFDDALREELIFHELGHCVLFRDHNNDLDENGIPVSIMHWQMSTETVYTLYRADWLIELFYYDGPEESGSTAGTTIN